MSASSTDLVDQNGGLRLSWQRFLTAPLPPRGWLVSVCRMASEHLQLPPDPAADQPLSSLPRCGTRRGWVEPAEGANDFCGHRRRSTRDGSPPDRGRTLRPQSPPTDSPRDGFPTDRTRGAQTWRPSDGHSGRPVSRPAALGALSPRGPRRRPRHRRSRRRPRPPRPPHPSVVGCEPVGPARGSRSAATARPRRRGTRRSP